MRYDLNLICLQWPTAAATFYELYMYVWHCQFTGDLTTKIDKTLYNMKISLNKKWRPLSAIVNIPS